MVDRGDKVGVRSVEELIGVVRRGHLLHGSFRLMVGRYRSRKVAFRFAFGWIRFRDELR